MVSHIFDILIEMIQHFGYAGILISTGMEYACFPVSSELLLPFIGYTISKGEMNLFLTILTSTVGGMIGCSFCYGIGRFGGNFIDRTICRKSKAAKAGIDHAKQFFLKHGKQSVLIGRIFPLVRTYISIPAGMAKMNYSSFLFYTTMGAFLWNTALISCGYFLGEHWEEAKTIIKTNSHFLLIGTGILIGLVLWKKQKNKEKA